MAHRILIVDDDTDFNTLLSDVYSHAEYEVITINDPVRALHQLRTDPYDLVVTDQVMPGMTGSEFVKEVHLIDEEIPVIMVSGCLENETIRQLIRDGVEGIFLKPLNVISLLKKTAELLERHNNNEEGTDSSGSCATQHKSNFSFGFRAFAGVSEKSARFGDKLFRKREFTGRLVLVGEKGTDFATICQDFCHFAEEQPDTFAWIRPECATVAGLQELIQSAHNADAARVTLAIPQETATRPEAMYALQEVAKAHAPFDSLSLEVRQIYCLEQDLDSLFDEGLLNERDYIFLSVQELGVPSLNDCVEDLPYICQHILAGLSTEKTRYYMSGQAEYFVRDQEWPGGALQLHKILDDARRVCPTGEISTEALECALEGKIQVTAAPQEQAENLYERLATILENYEQAVHLLRQTESTAQETPQPTLNKRTRQQELTASVS